MTNRATPKMRDCAKLLFADEAAAAALSQASVPAAFHVCEKLRRPLTTLTGAAGFHTLLLRALTLAKREAPGLSSVQVNAVGLLENVGVEAHEIKPQLDKHDAEEGLVLVAHLLGLLFTFIGESLTLRLVQDVCPDASFNRSTTEGIGKHEPQG